MTERRRPAKKKERQRRVRPKRETSAGGVVMRQNDGGAVVLLIRDSYGHWGLPKGHLERGEGSEHAAVREVGEETGLTDLRVLGSITTIEWRFRFRGRLVQKRCEFFLMEAANGATRPQKSEGITACRWFPMTEALARIGYDNARDVLRQADALITRQFLRTA